MLISAFERLREDNWPIFILSIAHFISIYLLNYPILLDAGSLITMKPLFLPQINYPNSLEG